MESKKEGEPEEELHYNLTNNSYTNGSYELNQLINIISGNYESTNMNDFILGNSDSESESIDENESESESEEEKEEQKYTELKEGGEPMTIATITSIIALFGTSIGVAIKVTSATILAIISIIILLISLGTTITTTIIGIVALIVQSFKDEDESPIEFIKHTSIDIVDAGLGIPAVFEYVARDIKKEKQYTPAFIRASFKNAIEKLSVDPNLAKQLESEIEIIEIDNINNSIKDGSADADNKKSVIQQPTKSDIMEAVKEYAKRTGESVIGIIPTEEEMVSLVPSGDDIVNATKKITLISGLTGAITTNIVGIGTTIKGILAPIGLAAGVGTTPLTASVAGIGVITTAPVIELTTAGLILGLPAAAPTTIALAMILAKKRILDEKKRKENETKEEQKEIPKEEQNQEPKEEPKEVPKETGEGDQLSISSTEGSADNIEIIESSSECANEHKLIGENEECEECKDCKIHNENNEIIGGETEAINASEQITTGLLALISLGVLPFTNSSVAIMSNIVGNNIEGQSIIDFLKDLLKYETKPLILFHYTWKKMNETTKIPNILNFIKDTFKDGNEYYKNNPIEAEKVEKELKYINVKIEQNKISFISQPNSDVQTEQNTNSLFGKTEEIGSDEKNKKEQTNESKNEEPKNEKVEISITMYPDESEIKENYIKKYLDENEVINFNSDFIKSYIEDDGFNSTDGGKENKSKDELKLIYTEPKDIEEIKEGFAEVI